MNAYFKIASTALCGMLLGLPVAQAQERSSTTTLRVEIGFSEHDFTAFPNNLTLKAGEPYRLELVNGSQGIRHIVIGPEFARAVVMAGVRKLPQREEMQSASFGGGIEVPSDGGRVEVYFVPYKEGRYKLFCEDQAHTQAGMDVTVDVTL